MISIFGTNNDSPESLFFWGLLLVLLGFYDLKKGNIFLRSRWSWEVVRMKGHDAHMYALLLMTIGFVMMMISLVGFAVRMSH